MTFIKLELAGYTFSNTDERVGFVKSISIPDKFNPNNEKLSIFVSHYKYAGHSNKPFVYIQSYYDQCSNEKDKQGNWLIKTAYQYTPMPGVQNMEDLATLERFLTYSHSN